MKIGGSRTVGFLAANTAMLWLTTAIAAVALWPIYHSAQVVVVVGCSALLSTVIVLLSARFRWPGFVVILVAVAAFLVFGAALANPSGTQNKLIPTLDGELDLIKAAALSWKQLLTITLPVGSYQTLLVPALILTMISTLVGLYLALRSRWPEFAVLAPVFLYLAATLFGPTFASQPREVALLLMAAIVAWLVGLRSHRRQASIRLLAEKVRDAENRPTSVIPQRASNGLRSALTAALIVLFAATAAFGATAALPPLTQRQVLRTAVEQPFDVRNYASPLSAFRSYEKSPAATAAMLTVTGLPTGARLRIATLDLYDGIVYSVGSDQASSESGFFTRVPYTFDQRATVGKPVMLDVTVDAYTGIWVPTAGQFKRIDFGGASATALRDSFYYNNESGTAAVVRPLEKGDTYSLSAVLPSQPSETQLASVKPGAAVMPPIGVVPDNLTSTLDAWTAGGVTAGLKLTAMLAALKKNGYVSHGVSANEPASRSGHAADRITELLTGQRMIGDQEQYSVTAAIMARQLGFPARVVFGFAPTNIKPASVTTVVGSDISAWIEVDTQQFGWVAVDPTPEARQIPAETPMIPTTIARPQSPVQPPAETPPAAKDVAPPNSSQDTSTIPDPLIQILLGILGVLVWVFVAALAALSPFFIIVLAKIRRRRLRRWAGTPQERITGGWQEFEDAVLDHGYTPPASHTRSEVAATIGGSKSRVLAAVADRAAFSPRQPVAEEAEQVWKSVNALRAALGTKLTRWQRIKAAVSLRSLGSRGGNKLFKR